MYSFCFFRLWWVDFWDLKEENSIRILNTPKIIRAAQK